MIFAMEAVKHVYEVRPRKDHRGVDLISDALPFGPPFNSTSAAAASVPTEATPRLRENYVIAPVAGKKIRSRARSEARASSRGCAPFFVSRRSYTDGASTS